MKRPPNYPWLASSLWLFFLAAVDPTQAQIVRDNTLPNRSVVNSQNSTDTITGGTQVGGNLFHSFREFSVPTKHTAHFNNRLDVDNIISRITGSSVSMIDGWVIANGTANLFLINPNGIVFGPNASLNIGGSFLASTAESVIFTDGSQFSATNPQASALLKVTAPVGLQFGSPQEIRHQSGFLEVGADKTLGLVGGNVVVEGFLSGGRVELGAVASNNQMKLAAIDAGFNFTYEGVENFQTVQLQGAIVSGSSVQIQRHNVAITDQSLISLSEPGAIQLSAANSLELLNAATVFTSNSGDILVSADQQFLLQDRASLSTSSPMETLGQAGNITITTDRFLVSNAQVFSSSNSEGQPGSITVRASNIELVGIVGTTAKGKIRPSGLLIENRSGSSPQTDENFGIDINTEGLVVKDGAAVSVTAFTGSVNAGNLTVRATDIELIGSSLPVRSQQGIPAVSGLFAGTEPGTSGNGGNLLIETDHLTILDGAEAQTSTLGAGNGGNLTVRATDFIELAGRTSDDQFPSGLLAVSGLEGVTTEATGQGGNLSLETGNLIVRDGAALTVSAAGTGQAGSISVEARSISLDEGSLRAETRAGDEGNTNIEATNILLRNNSEIVTNAEAASTGGDITINADLLALLEDSNIIAQAVAGQGGNIQITADGIFVSPDSLIDASSALGIDGEVTFNTPDTDPTTGVVELPTVPIDAAALIAQAPCALDDGRIAGGSSFTITGRGGLPPSADDPSHNTNRIVEWEPIEPPLAQDELHLEPITPVVLRTQQSYPPTLNRPPIQQIQGWVKAADGTITLTATAPTVTPQNPGLTHPRCQAASQ